MTDRRLAGVWIDHKKAIVVMNHDGKETFEFKIVDTTTNYDPVQHHNEQARQNAEQTNLTKFYNEVEKQLTNTEELYITGPGTAQEELKHHLHDTAQYRELKITLGTDQQMSEFEVLQNVKDHFNA